MPTTNERYTKQQVKNILTEMKCRRGFYEKAGVLRYLKDVGPATKGGDLGLSYAYGSHLLNHFIDNGHGGIEQTSLSCYWANAQTSQVLDWFKSATYLGLKPAEDAIAKRKKAK